MLAFMPIGMRRIVLAGATVVTLGCSGDDGVMAPTTTATTLLPGEAVDDLEPGDCLVDLPGGTRDRAETVDCDEPHRAEMYAEYDLDDGPYPGVEEVTTVGAQRCAGRYASYAGEPIDPTTARAFTEIVPSEASWADGDRRVVCLALPPGGAYETGSIADGAPRPVPVS